LRIVQPIRFGFAVLGCAGLNRVGAGILHVLPVLLRGRKARLHLCQVVGSLLEADLGAGLRRRGIPAGLIQRSLSLLHGGLSFHQIFGLRLRAKVGQLGARIREIQLRAPLIECALGLVALDRELRLRQPHLGLTQLIGQLTQVELGQ